jgi:DNA-binding response OmpR family regulator
MSVLNNGWQRILVVDDDAVLRRLTSYALRRAGYEVQEAPSADEGISRLGDAKVDAIITDVEMPGAFDGYDLAWQAHRKHSETPIFIVSGSFELDRRALPPNARFFEKPIHPAILVAQLRLALGFRRSEPSWSRAVIGPIAG